MGEDFCEQTGAAAECCCRLVLFGRVWMDEGSYVACASVDGTRIAQPAVGKAATASGQHAEVLISKPCCCRSPFTLYLAGKPARSRGWRGLSNPTGKML